MELEELLPNRKGGQGRPKSTSGRNLPRRLRAYEEAVLAFALVEGVPFTNNHAGRDLRPAEVKQKVKGRFPIAQRRGRKRECHWANSLRYGGIACCPGQVQ